MKFILFIFFSLLTIQTSCNCQAVHRKENTNPFTAYVVVGDTVTALGSNIMVIYQDRNNIFWFGSWESGVYRYDGKTLIQFTTRHGLLNNRIDEIQEDESGSLYFISCHPNSTIVKFDGHSFARLTAIPTNDWTLQSNDLWFRHSYSSEKVYRYDGIVLHELQLPKPPTLSNPFEIYSIYKDRKGSVWFGTNPSGVCCYNGKSFDWITEEDVTEFRNEGTNGVRSILEDKNGDFWFNTEYRYSIYDSTALSGNTFYTRHNSIGGLDGKSDSNLDEYLSIAIDDNHHLWFATYRNGVWKYDGTKVIHFAVQHNSIDIMLFCIYKDNHGSLWLGTHENGAYKFNGTAFEKFTP